MKKELITLQTDSKLTISKTKSLLALKNKLIPKKKNELVDDSWVERLLEWADEHNFYSIIEDKRELLNSTENHFGGVKYFPKEICNLIKLEFLSMSGKIIKIPKEIGNLTNLTWLSLSENQLTELPEEIGNLTNLTELYLDGNQLTKLPKNIKNLINLTWLELNDNNFKQFPIEIVNLKSLSVLYLWNNQLTNIPKDIVKLTSLTCINLANNQITQLPKEIINLTNLNFLSLSNNPNLRLTQEHKEWIIELRNNGCDIDLLDKTDTIEEILDIKENFMSNKFNGLLVDINNIDGIEIDRKTLFLLTKYSGKILMCEYEYEYEAKEDKIVFQGILNNDLCKVVLIDENYGLRGYPSNSEEYKELQMSFSYAVIDEDEIPF